MKSIYDITMKTLDGQEKSLSDYKGYVLLVVNTASHCGLAPQFEAIEQLYQTYKDRGLKVLGFPCGQFADQEEIDASEIAGICQKNYGVTFDMFGKIDVNGKNEAPLYTHLKSQQGGLVSSAIKWNFTKFLIDKDGKVVRRFSPTYPPEKIATSIEDLL